MVIKAFSSGMFLQEMLQTPYLSRPSHNQDDDEDMLELEANKASVETNIAALLEDEEVMDTNSARMSSSLPMILKVGVTYT